MNNTPIRILHVIGIMNRGGAETMIMNLYRHIDRSLVQFDFVENSVEPAAFDDEIFSLGGKIYRCPHYNGKNHFAYRKWWESFFAAHEGEYGIIHGHLGSAAAIYLFIAKKHGLYTIAHSHNTGTRSLRNALYGAYAFPTRYIADFFFGCSQAAGLSRYGQRVCEDPQRFAILKNAIETERFAFHPELREEIRKKFCVEDRLVIGHVGRFFAQKNHRFLIEVFAQIHRAEPRAVLLLVGDGELRPKIEEQVRLLDLTEHVIFTGVQADVSSFYQAMDVFAFPSLYEGLGIAVVEAQGTGLPCVISDKVPTESILADNLVTVMRLQDSSEAWAEHILSRLGQPRHSRTEELRAAGYDIHDTAKWLEEYYLNKEELLQ